MHPDPPSGRKKEDMQLAVSLERPADAAPEAAAKESLEERMIVELCLAGEPQHFRRLVERHQRGILGLTYRMLGNKAEAEDMAQQTFVDAFTALRDFNPTYKFSSWLYRIAINNCKDYLKSKKRTEQPLETDPSPGEAVFSGGLVDPETATAQHELSEHMSRALNKLPVKYRTVIILKDMDDLSYEEIRSILKLPITTLKIRVVRGRRMLKDILEKQP
jgi:RNA polymerase sigma-70 factor (ECF subfamily)